MKKVGMSLLFLTTLVLTSCLSSTHNGNKINPISSLFMNVDQSNQSDDPASDASFDNSGLQSISGSPKYDSIDIDLTTMNATMVYSEVYDMLYSPTAYVGKVVKMNGPFLPFEGTQYMPCYPAILIRDATACCASGIEFILYGVPICTMDGGNGYPLYNEEATIVGRFETYLEGSNMYVHLMDAIWIEGQNQ